MVPFRVTRLFGLKVQVEGMAIVNEQGIQLAFHTPEPDVDLFDAKVKAVHIGWPNLKSWSCDYGILGDRLQLQVNSLAEFSALPGVVAEQVELAVRKSDRKQLQEFEQRVREYQSGQRQDNTDELLDDIRDFLSDL